jgi:hypothetical protein
MPFSFVFAPTTGALAAAYNIWFSGQNFGQRVGNPPEVGAATIEQGIAPRSSTAERLTSMLYFMGGSNFGLAVLLAVACRFHCFCRGARNKLNVNKLPVQRYTALLIALLYVQHQSLRICRHLMNYSVSQRQPPFLRPGL